MQRASAALQTRDRNRHRAFMAAPDQQHGIRGTNYFLVPKPIMNR